MSAQAGDPLIEGPVVPQDLLKIKGEESLFTYMLEEVQAVYRKQGVGIAGGDLPGGRRPPRLEAQPRPGARSSPSDQVRGSISQTRE